MQHLSAGSTPDTLAQGSGCTKSHTQYLRSDKRWRVGVLGVSVDLRGMADPCIENLIEFEGLNLKGVGFSGSGWRERRSTESITRLLCII